MSGGHLNYAHSKLRHNVIDNIKHGDGTGGVTNEDVEWDVDETLEYLNDLADLLKAYSWWKSGDTVEADYREVERAFMEKWADA